MPKNFSLIKLSVIVFSICFALFGFTHNASAATYTWNPFLGGSGADIGKAVAVDTSGNVYVAGYSTASWGTPIRTFTSSGGQDAFVAKLNSNGALAWNTFLGGSGGDSGTGIAVDTSGNIYVSGTSDATWGSASFSGSSDAFVTKLDTNGGLTWNTFLGGSGVDSASGIAVDTSGNIYVSGTSDTTWGSDPKRTYTTSASDAFVAKLTSAGNLTWNTFLGGSGVDIGNAVAVDTSGNVYATGNSRATWGSPAPVRAYTNGGSGDAFIVKLGSNGSLTWNTFLGDRGTDYGYAITVDTSGNVYVTGNTTYFTISGAVLGVTRGFTGGNDAFVAKFDINGTFLWYAFLGGGGVDSASGIAVDTSGNVYIAGNSTTAWSETPVRAYDITSISNTFLTKFNTNGSFIWYTFLGGHGAGYGNGVAIDSNQNIYVGGYDSATWESPTIAYTASTNDAFASKLTNSGALVTITTSHNITATPGTNGIMDPSGATSVDDASSQTSP